MPEGHPLHPRPMLRRSSCTLLNGQWEFALGQPDASPDSIRFDRKINVPFAPESPASGVGHTDYIDSCWYRRTFAAPKHGTGDRVRLLFEAVDFRCDVWVNGIFVGSHEGGYTRFEFDITPALLDQDEQTVTVRVDDDAHDLSQPRGKQDWLRDPHAIWYPRTTGIWQSVWLEVTPAVRLTRLIWTPDLEAWQIALEAEFSPASALDLSLRVTLRHGEKVLVKETSSLSRDGHRRVYCLPDPGIDDARQHLLWTPSTPTLLDATLELLDENDRVLDRVESYTAMRTTAISGDRFLLNGRPHPLRLVLNQGYWTEGGMTAPDDDALRRDVELLKSLGFNGVRMHQKIECERFLYWADKLGLMVWEELPSVYQFSRRGMDRLVRQWTDAIRRDQSHPCIIAWVPVNESWGFPDLPLSAAQREGVRSLYHLTKALDGTRPVISNDGWEMPETDIIAVHDYEASGDRLRERFDANRRPAREIFKAERPGGRVMLLDDAVYRNQPVMLTEFGGVAFSPDEKVTWGYSRAVDETDFLARYARLLSAARENPLFSGFCYTQFTDTYQEANGLLRMDRSPKAPLERISLATIGPRNEAEREVLACILNPDQGPHANGNGSGRHQAATSKTKA